MANISVLYTYINNERGDYIMKKLILILAVLWIGLNAFSNSVKANEINKGSYPVAVAGHIIQNHDIIDKQKLMEAEIQKIGAQFALQMITIMSEHMPSIIDGIMAEMRHELNEKNKCLLLKDTKMSCEQ